MDTARFDNLVRSLNNGPSRRGLLAVLAGGLQAFVTGWRDVDAKK